MRPIFDKLRISREKLAFLVDSTSAPVVSLALVSSWIAVEVGYISEQYSTLGLDSDGLVIFVQTLPYRFYPCFMLAFGLAIAVTGRDFGPMRKAEAAVMTTTTPAESSSHDDHPARTESDLWSALPIALLILVALFGMWADGYWIALREGVDPSLQNVFGRSRSHVVLVSAALAGNFAALAISRLRRKRNLNRIARDWANGAKRMLVPVTILVLAWSLSSVCRDLKTAPFLIQAIGDNLPAAILPGVIFVLAAITSFATGTSWGTMAILFPLVVPLAHGISSGNEEIMLGAVSSILAGSVWGDHCSPISDTTIMSSLASGCDHIAHVRTQLPYALVVGAVSLVIGDLATGFGLISPWIALLVGIGLLLIIVRLFGRFPSSR